MSGNASARRPSPPWSRSSRSSCSPIAALVTDAPGCWGSTALAGQRRAAVAGPIRRRGRTRCGARDRCRERSQVLGRHAERPVLSHPRPGAAIPAHERTHLVRRHALRRAATAGARHRGHHRRRARVPQCRAARPIASWPIALADSTGFRHVVRGDRLDEAALLAECSPHHRRARSRRDRGPQHLPLRPRVHRGAAPGVTGCALPGGATAATLRGRPSRLQVAERTIGYRRYEVAGRHIVDTWMLAQLHDVGARDLPSFGLKDIARHFGRGRRRPHVRGPLAGSRAASLESPDAAHGLRGATTRMETLGVGAILAPPYFVQAQLLPFDYQSAHAARGRGQDRRAAAPRVSAPRPRRARARRGRGRSAAGYTAICQQGVARPGPPRRRHLALSVAHAGPGHRARLRRAGRLPRAAARTCATFRVRAKHLAREAADPEERAHQHALQQTFKILINAFYGYLAFSQRPLERLRRRQPGDRRGPRGS